jgi:hypothetical protein
MPTPTLYQAQGILNTARGIALAAWTPYAGLWNGDPRVFGLEALGGSYSRILLTFGAPVADEMVLSVQAAFPIPTADWGLVTHLMISDAITAGNGRYVFQLAGSALDRTITVGKPIIITAGALILRVPTT